MYFILVYGCKVINISVSKLCDIGNLIIGFV